MNRVKRKGGFTLVELLVVVLMIAILAAIAVPQYFRVVEKGRVAEAISYIDGIRKSEERTAIKKGTYVVVGSLDAAPPTLTQFTASAISVNGTTSWAIILTRNATPTTYGTYTIAYNSAAPTTFTCNNATCTNDLMP